MILIGLLVGLVVGFGLGYKVAKWFDLVDKEMEEMDNDEIS